MEIQQVDLSELTTQAVRDLISELEQVAMSTAKEHGEIAMPATHHFSKDIYAREIFIPAGTFLIGKIHRHENFNILSQGDMTLLSVQGCKRIQAPFSVVSPAGVKRVAYAHTDCVWTTIHGTDLKDVDKIEEEFIVKNYEDLDKEKLCLG